MQIPKKILKVWEPVIEDIGITAFAKGSGINFRTLKKALESGKCKDSVFEAAQKFISQRKKTVKKLLTQAA